MIWFGSNYNRMQSTTLDYVEFVADFEKDNEKYNVETVIATNVFSNDNYMVINGETLKINNKITIENLELKEESKYQGKLGEYFTTPNGSDYDYKIYKNGKFEINVEQNLFSGKVIFEVHKYDDKTLTWNTRQEEDIIEKEVFGTIDFENKKINGIVIGNSLGNVNTGSRNTLNYPLMKTLVRKYTQAGNYGSRYVLYLK